MCVYVHVCVRGIEPDLDARLVDAAIVAALSACTASASQTCKSKVSGLQNSPTGTETPGSNQGRKKKRAQQIAQTVGALLHHGDILERGNRDSSWCGLPRTRGGWAGHEQAVGAPRGTRLCFLATAASWWPGRATRATWRWVSKTDTLLASLCDACLRARKVLKIAAATAAPVVCEKRMVSGLAVSQRASSC